MNSLACKMDIKSVDANSKNNTKEGTRLYILLNRIVIVRRAYTLYWKENNTDKLMDRERQEETLRPKPLQVILIISNSDNDATVKQLLLQQQQ